MPLKKNRLYFLEHFSAHSKVERTVQRLLHRPPALHMHSLPCDRHTHRSVTVDKHMWTSHRHPESTVPGVHSWCCVFCGSARICSGPGPPAHCHTPWFRAPAGPLCPPRAPPHKPLAATDLCTVSLVWPVAESPRLESD